MVDFKVTLLLTGCLGSHCYALWLGRCVPTVQGSLYPTADHSLIPTGPLCRDHLNTYEPCTMHHAGHFTGCFVSVINWLVLMCAPTLAEEEGGCQSRVSWQVRGLGFGTVLSGRPLLLHTRLHGPPPTKWGWFVNDAVVGWIAAPPFQKRNLCSGPLPRSWVCDFIWK